MSKRIFISWFLSWIGALSLGLIYTFCISYSGDEILPAGMKRLDVIFLPGVLPVTIIVSTICSILISPLTFWSLGNKKRKIYLTVLWFLIALFIVWGTIGMKSGGVTFYGSLSIGILGLVLIALMSGFNKKS
jgi:membrane protein insertase Oxa1/YidC/SpoIIIJ